MPKLNIKYTIKIIWVYAPTSSLTDEKVFFLKGHAHTFHHKTERFFGFGSDGRNARGEIMLGFLLEYNLFQMNSFFKKKPHRRWTWESPNGRIRNGTDFIITVEKK